MSVDFKPLKFKHFSLFCILLPRSETVKK